MTAGKDRHFIMADDNLANAEIAYRALTWEHLYSLRHFFILDLNAAVEDRDETKAQFCIGRIDAINRELHYRLAPDDRPDPRRI